MSVRTKELQEQSAFSQYWYVDDLTDSFIEVKNNLQEKLTLLPLLTLSTGGRMKLDPITILPLSTERLSLKTQLKHILKEGKYNTKASIMRWGDGSRPNSLLGNAQLTPISQHGATARGFSAWIIIKDLDEGLGVVSPFKVPADSINTILEGIWWIPYPDTRAYTALQNTSDVPIELQMEIFSNGQQIMKNTLKIDPFGFKLIHIGKTGAKSPPQLGSMRFTYTSLWGKILPGDILSRGMLIEEKLGFSPSLLFHESLGNVPVDTVSELHAPAAIFGKLERLLPGSSSVVRPHLLLKNIATHKLTVQGAAIGKDKNGEPAGFLLKPLVLDPQSPVHINLEEQRILSESKLADGIAGLRLIHNGNPTDLVAELINIDQTGDFVLFDHVRNLFLNETRIWVAISFNLEGNNRTLLILKNVTDQLQQGRIVIDYEDGKKHYYANLLVASQQIEYIDIKRLRDERIPDINGQILPADVTFGGAVIFSEPGAFVTSDPTFFSRISADDQRLVSIGGAAVSCTEESFPGPGPRPRPDPQPQPPTTLYLRSPFRPESGQCFISRGCNIDHDGMDIVAVKFIGGHPVGIPRGEPIYAMASGYVTGLASGKPRCSDSYVCPTGREGNGVILRGGDDFLTAYFHMTPRPGLKVGDFVQAGEPIGTVDLSGFTTGPHVHVKRVSPGLGDYDDATLRLGICNFRINDCKDRPGISRELGVWPFTAVSSTF